MKKTNGKYTSTAAKAAAKKRKQKSRLIPVLCVLLVISALMFGAILWLTIRQGTGGSSDLQSAAQLEPVELPIQTQPPVTEPSQTQISTQAAQEETQPRETIRETEPAEKVMLEQYTQLYQSNTDMVGWLKIDDTKIDYPVMHTPDEPERYLHLGFDGKYNYGGTLFIDAACSADSDNLLIYGHNMLDGSMFRSLLKYENQNYWQEHPTIRYNTLYEEQEYEVLAAFYDRVYYKTENVFKFYQFIDAEDEADFDYAVSQFKNKSIYDTGVTAEYGDQLITLITCAYHTSNGRFVVVAVKK